MIALLCGGSEMLRRIELDVHERRQLEQRRRRTEERIRALQAAVDGSDGFEVPFMPKETVVTQRMYLKTMETKLQRINAELRQ
jgi:chemotaxis receptor (MCP) glutamine deamidase CheD